MEFNPLYKKAEQYITDLFAHANTEKLIYHNLEHTKKVVERTKEIAAHYNLIESDILVLYIAAWFHDVGYLYVEPATHEAKSAEVMTAYMREQHADEDLIKNIDECIMATKAPIEPANLLQQIIVDADTYNFGTKEFNTTNKQVYQEHVLRYGSFLKENVFLVKPRPNISPSSALYPMFKLGKEFLL